MGLTARRSATIALWVLTVLAVATFLRTARELLIPIVVAILVSAALEPLVARLERLRIPRVLGAGLVVATVVGSFAWGLYVPRDQVTDAMSAIPETIQRIGQWVGGRQAARQAEEATRSPEVIQQGVSWILSAASNLTIVTFFVFFLLLSGSHFKQRFVEVAGSRLNQRRTEEVLTEINVQVQSFLQVTAVTSVVVGVATWGALAVMGVRQAAVWGALAGVFNSIPYFGPLIVSGGLFAVGFLQFGKPAAAFKVAGVCMLITSVEGWVLTPLLLGRAEQMHVLVVFVGVLAWAWLWGPWGTVLAVPMLAVIKSICDHVEPLAPVSRLLAP